MSPSPAKKKRKARAQDPEADVEADVQGDAEADRGKAGALLSKPSLDDSSPPRPKRRRKKVEPDCDGIFNPWFQAEQEAGEGQEAQSQSKEEPAPRRSTRARSARVPLKPTPSAAASANAAALSLIPVRLPGSLNLSPDDGAANARKDIQKDLAAVTRGNTRKTKAGAVTPKIVIARQAGDSEWRIRERGELKIFEQEAAGGDPDSSGSEEGRRRRAKEVRWADTLFRVQGDDSKDEEPVVAKPVIVKPAIAKPAIARPAIAKTVVGGLSEERTSTSEKAGPITAEPLDVVASETASTKSASVGETTTTTTAVVPPPQAKEADKKATVVTRRTRASKLQPPTPRNLLATPAPTKTAAETAPTGRAAPRDKAPTTPAVRMATRRAKSSSLGMSGNGTPAPKRRAGRAGT